MTDSISFGKNGKSGKIDFNRVKDGLKKEEIAGKDKKLGSIFDKVDKDGNSVLDKTELQQFYEELSELAGDDNNLDKKEAKGFKKANGKKAGHKALYKFLNKLAENQQDPAAVQEQPAQQVQEQQTPVVNNEIPEQAENVVVAQAAEEIVSDENVDDDTEGVDNQAVSVEEEQESEPELTHGIIVQNGESPAVIAKKFGVPLQDLLDANEGALKGKGKNKYFLVGQEIVIPRKIEDEELAELTKNRKSAAETTGDYAHAMEVKAQRRAQIQAENDALGIQNRNGAGTKITGKYKGGKTEEFTVIGEAGRGRKVARTKDGKVVTIAHDGTILKDSYVQNTNFYDRKDTKKVNIGGKNYAVAGSRGDKHGRLIGVDEKGNQVVISGGEKPDMSDRKVLRNDYVSASDARDAGASRATLTGGKNVTYVRDANGKVWYFDEKTGKALVKSQHAAMVQKEADQISQDLLDGANYTWGTDEEKIAKGIGNIYSPEIMGRVNKKLSDSDNAYKGDAMTTPVEALLIDELSRSEVREHVNTLAANGAYGVGAAKDAALGRNAAREIKYELHGGTGFTTTKDLKDAMNLALTRGARIHSEAFIKKEVKGSANEGSFVRAYIAEDGWNAQEVDQFDATWIKNGAYDHEHDQEHRNNVTGRLVFQYDNDDALQAGLEAIDPDSADYEYVSTRAAEENNAKGYKAHFNNQEALQTYIAGRTANDDGAVNANQVSAKNTLLYKGEKPVRILAEEALYNAKQNDFSTMFDSMEPAVYSEMASMLADGEVKGCKDIKEAYDKALNSTTDINDKTKIKANAIVSGQIDFSDKEVEDFCVELMHRIDSNRGAGSSTGISAEHTNIADYETAQLKAILQARPEVIANVKERVQNGKFSYTTTVSTSDGQGPTIITQIPHDTKADYMAILNDSKHVADEAVFLDKDGNKITDPQQIEAITQQNMQSLQGMREYVAQLERDFKKGVDAEGGLSSMANGLLTYSGVGTDRDDVATQYREAKLMLQQLEAAAQGKLRDSEGNVISAQDLAQKIVDTQDGLAQANGDYESSMQMTKMGIVLAPVIVASVVAAPLAVAGAGALGVATTTAAGTLTAAGTVVSALGAGTAAGLTTYGINAYEYNTSLTGNTAEAREQNAIDSTVAGVSTFIGAAQMKPIMGLANGLNTTARTSVRLATTIGSDVTVGAAGEYASTGNVSLQGTLMNAGFSLGGNIAGIRSLGSKTDVPVSAPKVKNGGREVVKGEVNNYRDAIADGEIARNIDQQHLNVNQRRMVEDGLANVPTPEELAAYQKEIAYQPVPEADRPAFEAHQQQVAADYSEAHRLENNAKITESKPTGNTPKAADPTEVETLTQSIADIDKQIARAESNLASKARRGKQPTLQEKQQLERMQANRAAKQAELDALQKPATEPEVVVTPDEVVEPVVKPDETPAAEHVASAAEEPVFIPEEVVPTPENIVHDAQAIPEASIPAEHRSLWKSCQEKIGKIFSTGKALAKGEVKTVLADLKTLYNAVKNVQVRARMKNLYNKLVTLAKSESKPSATKEYKLSTTQREKMMDKFEAYHGEFLDINSLRNEYPQYNSLSDTELLNKFALNENHAAFVMNRKDLFGNGKYIEREYWNDSPFELRNNHSAWKMHLFSVDTNDYQQMAEVILPYLNKHKIAHKTLSSTMSPELLATSAPEQTGKAFTIYPQSQEEMEMIAKDLDRLIRQNNLTTGNSHITGDNQLGDSGRLFYRYEFPTGDLKDKIYKPGEYAPYDSNRGEGNYLANDMTPADDPWLNFDPSNPNSKPGQTASAQPEAPVVHIGVTPQEIGEIGDAINRAKNQRSLDQAQARIDRLPDDSPQKAALQRQANAKSRELRLADEPIEGRRPISEEPYRVDVSEQADIPEAIVEPEPYIIDVSEQADNVIMIDVDVVVTRAPREISSDIDMATTDFEFDALQKEIDSITNVSEKRALQAKLDKKRQEANNYPALAEYNQTNAQEAQGYDPANDPALWMFDDGFNSFSDDIGGVDVNF